MGIGTSVGGSFDSNCIYRCTDDTTTTHAVVLVGYNDTGNDSTSYWIIKNSWGTGWPTGDCNMGGYFKLGFNECNFTEEFEYVSYVNSPDFKPVIQLNSPENNNETNSNKVVFNFTVYNKNSTASTCNLVIDGVVRNTTSAQNATPTVTLYNMSKGTHLWKIDCWENNLGIMNSSEPRNLTVKGAPQIYVNNPQNTTYISLPVSINITTDEPADWCGWNLNDTGSNVTFSNSSSTVWHGSIQSSAQGTQHLYVYCNDTSGNMGSNTSVWFTYDSFPPHYQNETSSPSSPAAYSSGATYQFNITWVDEESEIDQVWIEHNFTSSLHNETVTTHSGSEYYFSIQDLSAGTYAYRWYANDTAGNTNGSFPQTIYTVNRSSRSVSISFDKTSPQNYGTQINVSCSVSAGSGDGTLKLYRNISDYVDVTSENNQFVILPAGTWSYLCNITEGTNYTGAETSDVFVVNKVAPNISIVTNCTWGGTEYETICNQTAYVNAGDYSATKILYRNGTQVGSGTPASEVIRLEAGSHFYNYTYEESENYTMDNVTNTLVITPKNANVEVFPTTQTISYGESTVQYCSDSSSLWDCSIWRNGTPISNGTAEVLGVGTYIFVANISDTQNYTNYENSSTLNVEKTVSHGSLSGSDVIYPNPVNVTPEESNSGDSDVNYTLWRNGTLVGWSLGTAPSSDTSVLAVGTYRYILNSTGGENYSSNSSIATIDITVSKGSTEITLYLNGTEWTTDQTFEYPHPTRINATINVSSSQNAVTFLVNGTPVSNPYETSHNLGVYNYTATYSGNDNYTGSSVTRFLTIQDTTPPNITSSSVLPSVVKPYHNLTVIAEATDNLGVNYITLNIYNTSWNSILEKNLTTNGDRWLTDINMSFSVGTYYFNLTAMDNLGNSKMEWIKNVTVNQSGADEVFTNNSVSTSNNQTVLNSTDTNTTIEIKVSGDVTNESLCMAKYSENPLDSNPSKTPLKYIEVEASSGIKDNLLWSLIKVFYTDEEVSSSGVDENLLRLYYYNETSDEWVIQNGGVNTSNNYVWGNVSHFSIYGVFGETSSTSTTTSTTTTSGGGGGGSSEETTSTTSTSTTSSVAPVQKSEKFTTTSSSTSTTVFESKGTLEHHGIDFPLIIGLFIVLLVEAAFILFILRKHRF